MADKGQRDAAGYYVRGADGKVFGPVDMATLVEWAGDSRIEPAASVSRDQKAWVAAPRVPELGMTWLVETAPGTFYGPFRRSVVDGLLSAGTIPRDTRLYELDDGRSSAERTRLKAELDARDAAIADLERRFAAQAETTRKTMSFMEAKVAELTAAQAEEKKVADAARAAEREEVFRTRERAEAAESRAAQAEAERDAAARRLSVMETELADIKAQLEAVTKLSGPVPSEASEAIRPEVVSSDPPPPRPATRFPGAGSSSGLAALEAAARRELASAKKQGISIGGIFGGKK